MISFIAVEARNMKTLITVFMTSKLIRFHPANQLRVDPRLQSSETVLAKSDGVTSYLHDTVITANNYSYSFSLSPERRFGHLSCPVWELTHWTEENYTKLCHVIYDYYYGGGYGLTWIHQLGIFTFTNLSLNRSRD